MSQELQARCELGQQQLMRTEYLEAENSLSEAEASAWADKDWDTLARLYMPLQEARRQIRQRCGEGIVALDLVATGPEDHIDGHRVIENYSHGQLLVGGWGSIEPAVTVRQLKREHGLYVETFLAAVYPIAGAGRIVAIVPSEEVAMPTPEPRAVDDLIRRLPPHCIVMGIQELPLGSRKGNTEMYAQVMAIWERLHAPFLAAADQEADPVRKIDAYRRVQRVDPGSELAHQKASDVARELARSQRART